MKWHSTSKHKTNDVKPGAVFEFEHEREFVSWIWIEFVSSNGGTDFQ